MRSDEGDSTQTSVFPIEIHRGRSLEGFGRFDFRLQCKSLATFHRINRNRRRQRRIRQQRRTIDELDKVGRAGREAVHRHQLFILLRHLRDPQFGQPGIAGKQSGCFLPQVQQARDVTPLAAETQKHIVLFLKSVELGTDFLGADASDRHPTVVDFDDGLLVLDI